jgi:hypothetical protein
MSRGCVNLKNRYGEIQLNLLSQYNNLSTIVSPSAIEKWPDKRVAFSGRGL